MRKRNNPTDTSESSYNRQLYENISYNPDNPNQDYYTSDRRESSIKLSFLAFVVSSIIVGFALGILLFYFVTKLFV